MSTGICNDLPRLKQQKKGGLLRNIYITVVCGILHGFLAES